MFANNYTSSIVRNQLPEFIRTDHPNFVNLLEKYYQYMEQEGKTTYVGRRLYDYMDLDTTRADLLKYFKATIIPSFPEETELSQEKLIKAARDFYAKKGTPDGFRFLFRVLYNQEIEVYFPKEDILRASDGKWKLPQALRISIADTSSAVLGGNVNVFASSANTVNANGINFLTSNFTANSYIRIGSEKRKITEVAANYLRVNIPFAANGGLQYYDSETIYKLTLSEYNDFDFNLIERRKGYGEISKTSCIIESAVRTVDKDTGREIVEIYISNVNKPFQTNENLVVNYYDPDTETTKTFSSKIIALISNISLSRNRFGVVQSGARYKVGDPVVFFGGLNQSSDEAVKAVATVKEVSTGTLDSVSLVKSGYYFRDYPNSAVRIIDSAGIGANLLIDGILEDGGSNSASFAFNTDSIFFKKDLTIDSSYNFENVGANNINLTVGIGNTTTSINLNTTNFVASSVNDYYKSHILQVFAGTGASGAVNTAKITAYNGTTKVATLSPALTTAPNGTSKVRIFANAQTEIGRASSYETYTLGKISFLNLVNRGSFFEGVPEFDPISLYQTDYSELTGFYYIPIGQMGNYNKTLKTIELDYANSSYSFSDGFYTGARLFIDVGETSHYVTVVDYVVSGSAKTLYLDRTFDNNINNLNAGNFRYFLDFRGDVRDTGKLGAVEILNGGTGYSSGDKLIFIGTGYNGTASLTVSGGVITGVTLTDRGEGYVERPTAQVVSSSGGVSTGSGAAFAVYTLSDGEEIGATTSGIGEIRSFDLSNRGYDYTSTPVVSLKIADIISNNLSASDIVISGDAVWQGGSTNVDATFTGIVDEVYRPNETLSIIRIFNYNGTFDATSPLKINTATQNIVTNVFQTTGSYSFNNINPATSREYPYFYGNGLAKANAEFSSGLIKYQGYYLNTDGHISADKKIQNKNYYHNFSYEIQSEKQLKDYKETMYKVAHPAGMHLLSKYLMKDVLGFNITSKSNTHTYLTVGEGNPSITSLWNTANVTSSYALFDSYAVDDIVIINASSSNPPLRQYARKIASIPNSTKAILESPASAIGDGRLIIEDSNNLIRIHGNTYPLSHTFGELFGGFVLASWNQIKIGIPGSSVSETVSSVTGNVITISTGFSYDDPASVSNLVSYTINSSAGDGLLRLDNPNDGNVTVVGNSSVLSISNGDTIEFSFNRLWSISVDSYSGNVMTTDYSGSYSSNNTVYLHGNDYNGSRDYLIIRTSEY